MAEDGLTIRLLAWNYKFIGGMSRDVFSDFGWRRGPPDMEHSCEYTQ